LGEDMSLKTG